MLAGASRTDGRGNRNFTRPAFLHLVLLLIWPECGRDVLGRGLGLGEDLADTTIQVGQFMSESEERSLDVHIDADELSRAYCCSRRIGNGSSESRTSSTKAGRDDSAVEDSEI
jgi:hypothetical protein